MGGTECSVGMFDKRTAELQMDCQHTFSYVLGCFSPKNIYDTISPLSLSFGDSRKTSVSSGRTFSMKESAFLIALIS